MSGKSSSGKPKKRKLQNGAAAGGLLKDVEEAPGFDRQQAAQIQRLLLGWYDRQHRALPWRRNPHSQTAAAQDPEHLALLEVPQQQMIYRVWISEIMCQQTQVARAAEYFRRWLLKWPDVQSLAGATLDEVNDLWAGLGYYRRAKYLHSGAQHVVSELGGHFPTTSRELQKIPGIGAYTGAAIASIACGEQAAVVDANVVRVLARLLKISEDPSGKAAVARFASEAAALLNPERPGDFNQAMMEHGAVTCTQAPKCEGCVVRTHCAAYADVQWHVDGGNNPATAPPVTRFPTKVAKAARKEQRVAVCIVRATDAASGAWSYLLVKRAEKGLLAGLWEFPSVLLDDAAPAQRPQRRSAINDYLRDTLELFPDAMTERRDLGNVAHVFSHIAMALDVEMMSMKWEAGIPDDEPGKGLRWLMKSRLATEGLSSVMRKVAALIDKPQIGAKQQQLPFARGKKAKSKSQC